MRSLKWVLPVAALLVSSCQSAAAPASSSLPKPYSSPSALQPHGSTTPEAHKPSWLKPHQPVSVRRMQRILLRYGYPVGPADGKVGPRTEQGLCGLRGLVWGHEGRKPPTRWERRHLPDPPLALPMINTDNSLPKAARDWRRGIAVNVQCQVAYLINKGSIQRVIPVSTGGHYRFYDNYTHQYEWADTIHGLFKLSWRQPGKVTSNEVTGVMYYPWFFHGGTAVHGEVDPSAVPPYPVSHGCVRMSLHDILYIWHHYRKGDPVLVYQHY